MCVFFGRWKQRSERGNLLFTAHFLTIAWNLYFIVRDDFRYAHRTEKKETLFLQVCLATRKNTDSLRRTATSRCLVFIFIRIHLKCFSIYQHNELTDAMVDCETLWGVEGRILEEKVMLARDNARRVEIVSNFLLDRIKMTESRDSGFMFLVKKIIANNILVSIPSFVSDCNLSRRQLERKFKEFSGFSPEGFFQACTV